MGHPDVSRKSHIGTLWETLSRLRSLSQFLHHSWQLVCQGDKREKKNIIEEIAYVLV